MFDNLYFVDLVVLDLVFVSLGFWYCLFFLPSLVLIFSVLAKRLARKSISDMQIYFQLEIARTCWEIPRLSKGILVRLTGDMTGKYKAKREGEKRSG